MDLSELVDEIVCEIEDGLPAVASLGEVKQGDPALFFRLEAEINARVAEAISETVLALFRVLGTKPNAQRVL